MVGSISLIVVGIAAMLGFIVTIHNLKETYMTKLSAANQEILDNSRDVYISTKDILAGAMISDDNTTFKKVLASQAQDTYITSKDFGKTALVNIKAGTQITNAIITNETVASDLRETYFNVITNSKNIKNNNTVDVRILYPNGENKVVLSKKSILNLSKEKTDCYFWLSEEEIQLMSSAIVDAYMYKGTQLYTTKYIKPTLQKASIVDYTPSLSTINLIKSDPNIVKIASKYLNSIVRKELENRLADSLKHDVTKTDWQTDTNETQDTDSSTQDTTEESSSTVKEPKDADTSDNYYYEDEKKDKGADREYGE